jgi:hypothetical protein
MYHIKPLWPVSDTGYWVQFVRWAWNIHDCFSNVSRNDKFWFIEAKQVAITQPFTPVMDRIAASPTNAFFQAPWGASSWGSIHVDGEAKWVRLIDIVTGDPIDDPNTWGPAPEGYPSFPLLTLIMPPPFPTWWDFYTEDLGTASFFFDWNCCDCEADFDYYAHILVDPPTTGGGEIYWNDRVGYQPARNLWGTPPP